MDIAKIRLSPKEIELVNNGDWILTKNVILDKCVQLFSIVHQQQEQYIKTAAVRLPKCWINASPKISKGENYLSLPYRMLDYPAYFDKENIAAIRTFFWWGNFFSVTLHLSGIYKDEYKTNIANALPFLQESQAFICINDDQWQHHFEVNNYQPLKNFTLHELQKMHEEKQFIKLAINLPLDIWESANEKLLNAFKIIIKLMAD